MDRADAMRLLDDLHAAQNAIDEPSFSATTTVMPEENEAVAAHRRALSCWLDELDERYGPPTSEELERADRLIDEALGLRDPQRPGGSTP